MNNDKTVIRKMIKNHQTLYKEFRLESIKDVTLQPLVITINKIIYHLGHLIKYLQYILLHIIMNKHLLIYCNISYSLEIKHFFTFKVILMWG